MSFFYQPNGFLEHSLYLLSVAKRYVDLHFFECHKYFLYATRVYTFSQKRYWLQSKRNSFQPFLILLGQAGSSARST